VAPARRPRVLTLFAAVLAQALGSSMSVLLTVVAATRLSVEEFGRFALSGALVFIAVGLGRAFATEPLIWREPVALALPVSRWAASSAACATLAGVLALIAGGITAQLGRPVDAGLLLILVPVAALHEHGRLFLLNAGRALPAFLTDTVGLLVVALAALGFSPSSSAEVLGVWAAASSSASLVACVAGGVRPSPRAGLRWLLILRRRGLSYAADFSVTAGIAQASLFLAAAFAGPEAAGAIRGAQTLLLPVTTVTRAIAVALSPEAARLGSRGAHRSLARLVAAYAALSAIASAAVIGLSTTLPETWFAAVLGESAEAALRVLPWSSLAAGALGMAMAFGLAIRAYGAVDRVAVSKMATAPGTLLAMALAAGPAGASGTQAALALGTAARGVWSAYIYRDVRSAATRRPEDGYD
jgi:O-antigen/teichoic acid export membrane protein